MSDFIIENGILKEYSGAGGEVVVPDGVTAIGESAFWNSYITAVKLPVGLKKIGEGAFRSCSKLKRIEIPKTVTSIATDAFSGSGIEQIVLPPKLTRISNNAFAGSNLEEITVPEAVKIIGRQAFYGCRQLKKVILPANLKKIDVGVFKDCINLTEINIPSGVSVESGAFDRCIKLMDNDGFIVIDGALYNCPGLYKSHKVKLPDGIKVIKGFSIDIRRDVDGVIWALTREELQRAREGKVGSVIEIPASVELYESGAFMGDIEEIISHSTAGFKSFVFSGCTKLKKLTVPEGTDISENVFGYREKDVASFKKLIICHSEE